MPDLATNFGHGRESKGRKRKSASLHELDKFRPGNISTIEEGTDGGKKPRAADCMSDEKSMNGRIVQPVCMECKNLCAGYHGMWQPSLEESKRDPTRKTWGTCCGACERAVEARRAGQ